MYFKTFQYWKNKIGNQMVAKMIRNKCLYRDRIKRNPFRN